MEKIKPDQKKVLKEIFKQYLDLGATLKILGVLIASLIICGLFYWDYSEYGFKYFDFMFTYEDGPAWIWIVAGFVIYSIIGIFGGIIISIIIANIITKRSVREILPKYSKNSLSKQKSLLKQNEMRSSLPEIWYLKEDNKIQRLKKEKLEKERKRLEVEKRGMEKRYKRERPIIEKLIQEMKFSEAILKLKDIKNASKKYNLSEINSWVNKKLDKLERKKLKIEKIDRVKKAVLELGIKFARLQIAEISEVCGIDDVQLIVDTVNNMIENKEIYAQYFSSTKSVAFDQQTNIDEIDKLMSTYKDWEDKKVGKK
ncbi:hypothetical protein LCGC14_1772860 [marine sediment metagenome]|uniref:Uncharacterized protein n=1 Tax=marine sediment metagenome TaxID=412755 RepID=A0A0F9GXS5_9ZZZZ